VALTNELEMTWVHLVCYLSFKSNEKYKSW